MLAHRRLISVTVDLSHAQAGSLLGGSGSTASKGSDASLAGVLTCGCREHHLCSSGDEPVLVDQPAKDFGSSNVFRVGIGDRDDRFGDRQRAAFIEGSVRPVPVVVVHVLGEHGFEVAAAEDEEPVEALSADGTDKALGDGIRARGPDGRLDDPDSLGCKTASKEEVNLAGVVRSARSKERLRACWVTQPVTGLAVTPAMWTRRVSCSTKNNT